MERDRNGRYNRALAVKLGVSVAEVMKMTPAQIQRVVFYPRKSGKDELQPPVLFAPVKRIAPTYERDRAYLESLRPEMRAEKYEADLVRLEEVWAARRLKAAQVESLAGREQTESKADADA